MDFSIDVAMPHLIFDETDFAMPPEDQAPSRHEPLSATTIDDIDATSGFHDDDASTVIRSASNLSDKPPDNGDLDCASDSTLVCQIGLGDSYKDLLQLSVALAEDQEALGARMATTSHFSCKGQTPPASPEDCPIGRVLKRTSRFWDILKNILQGHGVQQRTPTGNAQPQLAAVTVSLWPRTYPNILTLVQILTTYVSLVRLCRDIFLHLYHVLQVVPLSHLDKVLHLPSLHFGEFQMENSISFQVQALIQLNTSMLLRIEEALGTSTSSISGLSGTAADCPLLGSHAQRGGWQSIMSDPIVASLREIILSHERTWMTTNGTEQPTLMAVIRNLKRLLQQH